MTDKERLEGIKNSYLEGIHSLFGTHWASMPKENLDWLLNRIEELEKELNKQMNIGLKFEGEANELQKQNKRYHEAMETVLKVSEYYNAFGGDLEIVRADMHNILDKALEGEK